MTALRRRMLEDMQVRNLSPHTQTTSVQHVARFACHFQQSPEALGPEEIRAVKIVSLLLTHLPETYDYQVVFMRRDFDEILASQNKMLESRGEPKGADDARVKTLYAEHLAQVERFLSRRRCFSTLMLEYRDLVSDPAREVTRLNTFVGSRLDEAKMAAVADRNLYRNRRD